MKQTSTKISEKEKNLRSKIYKLISRSDCFLHGSLIEMSRRCGNPKCRCARGGAKHKSLYLGQTKNGKTRMQYIGNQDEDEVRRYVKNADELRGLVEQTCDKNWKNLFGSSKRKNMAQKNG